MAPSSPQADQLKKLLRDHRAEVKAIVTDYKARVTKAITEAERRHEAKVREHLSKL